jgi:hypothetical protein
MDRMRSKKIAGTPQLGPSDQIVSREVVVSCVQQALGNAGLRANAPRIETEFPLGPTDNCLLLATPMALRI